MALFTVLLIVATTPITSTLNVYSNEIWARDAVLSIPPPSSIQLMCSTSRNWEKNASNGSWGLPPSKENDPRFFTKNEVGVTILVISHPRPDDVGCYFCKFHFDPPLEDMACLYEPPRPTTTPAPTTTTAPPNTTTEPTVLLTPTPLPPPPPYVIATNVSYNLYYGNPGNVTLLCNLSDPNLPNGETKGFAILQNGTKPSHMDVVDTGPGSVGLLIRHPTPSDFGCYPCGFQTTPPLTSVACLNPYHTPDVELRVGFDPNTGEAIYNCSVHARPPAELTFMTNGSCTEDCGVQHSETYSNDSTGLTWVNGTGMVIHRPGVALGVWCFVTWNHTVYKFPMTPDNFGDVMAAPGAGALEGDTGGAPVAIIIVVLVLVILLALGISVYLYIHKHGSDFSLVSTSAAEL